MIAYALIGAGINFPVMCLGYGICGVTMAVSVPFLASIQCLIVVVI